MIDRFTKLLNNRGEAEEYYLVIHKYFSTLAGEMMKYYMNHEHFYNWEFAEYCENLTHETGHYGGNVINGVRNYEWYLTHDKSKVEEQKKSILHNLYLFILGVQSVEILYNEKFEEIKK